MDAFIAFIIIVTESGRNERSPRVSAINRFSLCVESGRADAGRVLNRSRETKSSGANGNRGNSCALR